MNVFKFKSKTDEPGPYTKAMIVATRELGLTDIEFMDVGSVAVMGRVIENMAKRIVELEAAAQAKPKGDK